MAGRKQAQGRSKEMANTVFRSWRRRASTGVRLGQRRATPPPARRQGARNMPRSRATRDVCQSLTLRRAARWRQNVQSGSGCERKSWDKVNGAPDPGHGRSNGGGAPRAVITARVTTRTCASNGVCVGTGGSSQRCVSGVASRAGGAMLRMALPKASLVDERGKEGTAAQAGVEIVINIRLWRNRTLA